jgi:hypothetical protein
MAAAKEKGRSLVIGSCIRCRDRFLMPAIRWACAIEAQHMCAVTSGHRNRPLEDGLPRHSSRRLLICAFAMWAVLGSNQRLLVCKRR